MASKRRRILPARGGDDDGDLPASLYDTPLTTPILRSHIHSPRSRRVSSPSASEAEEDDDDTDSGRRKKKRAAAAAAARKKSNRRKRARHQTAVSHEASGELPGLGGTIARMLAENDEPSAADGDGDEPTPLPPDEPVAPVPEANAPAEGKRRRYSAADLAEDPPAARPPPRAAANAAAARAAAAAAAAAENREDDHIRRNVEAKAARGRDDDDDDREDERIGMVPVSPEGYGPPSVERLPIAKRAMELVADASPRPFCFACWGKPVSKQVGERGTVHEYFKLKQFVEDNYAAMSMQQLCEDVQTRYESHIRPLIEPIAMQKHWSLRQIYLHFTVHDTSLRMVLEDAVRATGTIQRKMMHCAIFLRNAATGAEATDTRTVNTYIKVLERNVKYAAMLHTIRPAD